MSLSLLFKSNSSLGVIYIIYIYIIYMAVTTVFWVLQNCASWTFSGIGCVLIKHIQ